MLILSEEQLNNLNKEALVIIAASLQDQMQSLYAQLDKANAQLADTNRQIELLTEQIRIMNQRQFGRHSESGLMEGQLTLFDSFNEAEATADAQLPDPDITEVVISSYRRKKSAGKREEDLEGLPARVFDHRIPVYCILKIPTIAEGNPKSCMRNFPIIADAFDISLRPQ